MYFHPWFDNDEYELDTDGITDYTPDELDLKAKYNLSDRKLAWRRWKMAELGQSEKTKSGLTPLQLFKQEYPSNLMEAFQASGNTFFDQETVENIVTKTPIRVTDFGLNIWYEPIPGHEYVVGCDPSTAKGIDFASIDVWDVNTLQQVAQWHGFMDPDKLAEVVQAAAELYNKALASVENNLLTTVLSLSKTYDNIYFTIRIDKKTEQRTKILGFSTNLKTRPVMLDHFQKLFRDGLIEINSEITKSEMRTFLIKENAKIEHAEGKHDDSLFASFIALETRNANPNKVTFYKGGGIG